MTAAVAMAAVVALAILALALQGVVASATLLWDQVGGVHPYFPPGAGLLVHGVVPVVLAAGIVTYLAPGLLLALATGPGRTASQWVVRSLPWTLATSVVVVELARLSGDSVLAGAGRWILFLAPLGLAMAVLWWRDRAGRVDWSVMRRGLGGVAIVAGATVLALWALVPKLLWESFNGDGAQAHEVAQLLLAQPLPFFPPDAGALTSFPDWTSLLFAFPDAWFMHLLGPHEVSVRLPFVATLPWIGAGVLAAAEREDRPVASLHAAVAVLGMAAFVLLLSFSATYSPYHADLALPAPREALLVAGFVGFVHAAGRREWGWVAAFALVCHLTMPTGLMLIGLWAVAEFAVVRPMPRGVLVRLLGLALGLVLATTVLTAILTAQGAMVPGEELGIRRALLDMTSLRLTDWRRPVQLLVAAGIFPVLVLAAWRRQDTLSRRITVVVLGYFCYFAVQMRFAPHHLAPIMVLPAVVAIRSAPTPPALRRRWFGAWAMVAIVAVALSLPRDIAVSTDARQVGERIALEDDILSASRTERFRAMEAIERLFPYEWEPDVPGDRYGGAPLAWVQYARPASAGGADYLVHRDDAPAAPSWYPVGTAAGYGVSVRDTTRWATDRARERRLVPVAPVYRVPRRILFGLGGNDVVRLRQFLPRRGGRRLARGSGGPAHGRIGTGSDSCRPAGANNSEPRTERASG